MHRANFVNQDRLNNNSNNEYSYNFPEKQMNNRSLSNMKGNHRPQVMVGAQIMGAKRDLTPNNVVRRALPIVPKKGIFNEWAAVLKYNDEKDQKNDYDQMTTKKIKMEEYRKSLEDQIKIQNMKTKSLFDQKLIEKQTRKEQEKQFNQKHEYDNRREREALNIYQNIQDIEKKQKETKVIRNIENENFKRQIKMSEENENKRAETNRAVRINNASKLRQSLDDQLATKRKMHQEERIQDQQILNQGLKQEEHQEKQRNEFFNKLKLIQEINEKRVG